MKKVKVKHGSILGWRAGCRCRLCAKAWYHLCSSCRIPFAGEINWDCEVNSPTLKNLCDDCHPITR